MELIRTTLRILVIWAVSAWCVLPATLRAQGSPTAANEDQLSLAPARVGVNPVASDEQIQQRLQRVLAATDWFSEPEVVVEAGVVFLRGQVDSAERKKWAGDLARNTEEVVAVANEMVVAEPEIWDLGPGWAGLRSLWRDFVRSIPLLLFGLLILGLSAVMGVLSVRVARKTLKTRVQARLLREVAAVACGVLVFLVGTYVVLRVSGLTQLALTVVGGTGLLGLAVGIAFRDITENFLASIFLSMQRPFETGDLIEVTGVTGFVQQLNVRVTVVMTLDGNLVQIPNSSVYKNNITNFTTNPSRRGDFVVGIGYDDSINEAQEIARRVLAEHPAVLKDPEPLVLVENLGKATVDLRVFFWLNGREHSFAKVRSSVIRLVKRAFQQNGIEMPDEAREVVFPQGLPVTMVEASTDEKKPAGAERRAGAGSVKGEETVEVATKAEAGLYSEAGEIEEQARQAQPIQEGENLLPAGPPPASKAVNPTSVSVKGAGDVL